MLRSYLALVRQFSRDARLALIATAVIGFTVSGGIYGVLLNLYLLRLDYGPEFIGLVNAMSPLAIVLFSLPASGVGGRWGNRLAMVAGLALTITGNALLALIDAGAARSGWILATYLLAGTGMALYLVNVNPFLMQATTPRERNHVFSGRMALLPLAGFAGSLVGGLLPGVLAGLLGVTLDDPAPFRWSLVLAAVLAIPAVPILLSGASHDDRRPDRQAKDTPHAGVHQSARLSKAIPLMPLLLLPFIGVLRVMGEGAPRAFFNVYLDAGLGVPTAQIGAQVAVARLLAVPACLLMPLLAERWGNGRVVVIGAAGVGISLLPLALIPHWAAAGLGFASMTALAAIARSAFIVYTMEAVSPRWQATMSAATTMSASISWGATALIGGYLIGSVGYGAVFLFGACSTLAGALLFWWCFCRGQ